MHVAPLPPNEIDRLAYLTRLEILDTVAEQCFDDVTRIASLICETPIALISLVDRDRQWFKSTVGLDAEETPRDPAFCSHAILTDTTLVVEDAHKDDRFRDNPLVTGEPRVRFYAGAPLRTDEGLGIGTLCVIDHEPRVLSPEQLESLEALSRQILRQFELRLLVNEQRRVGALKDEFVATVSHELRTPLTSIRGSLSLINSGQLGERPPGQVGDLLQLAERNAVQLGDLVDDLLDMQKIEAGKFDLSLETVSIHELVDSGVALNSRFVQDRGSSIRWQPSDASSSALVSGDRRRILQVLTNLLSNAAKASTDGGEIEVKVSRTDDVIRVSVADQGCGIPESAKASLFTKFYQVDSSSTRRTTGTGLGLAISRRLVELHGGTMGFESQLDEGSTFYFELPIAPAVVAAT